MKKLFSLFAVLAMAAITYAQSPVLGTDYEWKYVTESMTTVPADFCEGVSQEDAVAQLLEQFAIGTIYGALPAEDGAFQVVLASGIDEYTTGSKTWSEIALAVADWDDYYYPARKAATALDNAEVATCSKSVINGQLVIVKGNTRYNVLGSEIR